LLDINMPVMDGIEFLEAYQHLPLAQRQAVIIVVLTTSVSPRDLLRVQQLPIAATFNKPLIEANVLILLNRYFPDLADLQ
jgi:CheY-like chemotaxis protein